MAKPKTTETDDPEVKLLRRILASDAFKGAPSRRALLEFLFERRAGYTPTDTVIEEFIGQNIANEGIEDRVRERMKDLRKGLERFSKFDDGELVCSLPLGVQAVGYQLKIKQRDRSAPTRIFWAPHLKERRLYVVYVEQLFFQNWPKRFVFRHADLNAENPNAALAELKDKYPDDFKGVSNAAYPYVAYGEIGARDAISQWFMEEAFLAVEPVVTRRMNDAEVWNGSSIMLGEKNGNSMIRETLAATAPLDISLEVNEDEVGFSAQALVRNANEEERVRNSRFDLVAMPDGFAIPYFPERGRVAALVTRVRNTQSGKIVTILNSEFARSIEQLALLLTDDKRVEEMLKALGWEDRLPDEFQILFYFYIDSVATAHRAAKPEIVTWRPYRVTGNDSES